MADTVPMLKSHPQAVGHIDQLAACIDACGACLVSCNACADACLGGSEPQVMARCIRLDLDCADLCAATLAVLCRQTAPDYGLIRKQVESMQLACRACGDECMNHADRMEHCRLCGETCRDCEQKCDDLLAVLPAAA